MHFKRLELFGFKSFAERSVFHFEPGVTAIVGPNGCGKTNCVDAIRWVLGEQNPRDLRGSTMEDVIFNGTDAIPALGFAEVSLTLSNDDRALPVDYSEVTVARRVYRSGESEYLLNKLPVRLKDIQELFMGTGIGTESYSIIGQGKINLILSSRPEDRREIFEEASGITKYKTKKREALRRLDETEQNLLRINDITTEVQRQLRSIERLAEKARKYQERFDRLREAELTAAAIEHAGLQAKLAARADEGRALDAQARELVAQWEALRAQLEDVTAQREELLQRLSRHMAEQAQLRGALERHAREVQLKTQWGHELESQVTALRADSERLREKLRQDLAQRENLQASLRAAQLEVAQHDERARAAEAQVAEIERVMTAAQRAVQDAQALHVDHAATVSKAKSELAKLGATAQAHHARARRLRADHAELTTQAGAGEQQRHDAQAQCAALEAEVASAAQQLITLQARRVDAEQAAQRAQEALHLAAQARAQCAAECELLEQMWRRHEGYAASTAALLESQQASVIGVAADWLEVQPGYEVAIEAALGDAAQSAIVADTATAFRLMAWLREHRHGRAHFVALDRAALSTTTDQPITDSPMNGATPASQLVTVRDAHLTPWVRARLADVWIVEDLAQVSHWPVSDVRLVDRLGNTWSRGGLTGGEPSERTSLIGRPARVEAARERLQSCERAVAEHEQALASAKRALSELQQHGEQQSRAAQELQERRATLVAQRRQLEEASRRITEERDVVATELAEAEEDAAAIAQAQERCAADVSTAEAALQTLEQQLVQYRADVTARAQAREAALIELTRLKANFEGVATQQQAVERSLGELAVRQQEAEQTLAAQQARLLEAQRRIEQLGVEIEEHRRATESLVTEEQRAGTAVSDVTRQADELKHRVDALDQDVRRAQDVLTGVREQQREHDQRVAELAFREQTLVERTRDHYQCEIPPHQPSAEDEAQLATLRATIGALREKLEAIGPVSLGSIAEQEELTQRLTFLTTQQQDLLQAQAALKEAIQKVNRETRKLFLETFARIQQEFQYFFKLLFGGGRAELTLLDEQDVLDCGIEIIAQPPGKKLQSISLLSGGEQAMTAVALLFALFKVRPSPFCILDEIDAPLDEANVDRFTKGLSEFTKLSQFIIVTHNKKTITRGDVMYGITMEQPGISKIVSVKFAEAAHESPSSASPSAIGTPA